MLHNERKMRCKNTILFRISALSAQGSIKKRKQRAQRTFLLAGLLQIILHKGIGEKLYGGSLHDARDLRGHHG